MIEIYLDSAKFLDIYEGVQFPYIKGFTTNPSLMKAAGVPSYRIFAEEIIKFLKDNRPDTNLSLEVFADDHREMMKQALILHDMSVKSDFPVFIKIPITNTQGQSTADIVYRLHNAGVRVNVTAVFEIEQTEEILYTLGEVKQDLIISVFAGRIADTGVNAMVNIAEHIALRNVNQNKVKFLWASCRQPYSYLEAKMAGADIITMTLDQIKKRDTLFGKNLKEYSLETVKMFFDAAKDSGYTLE